jgi:hypothetical protein
MLSSSQYTDIFENCAYEILTCLGAIQQLYADQEERDSSPGDQLLGNQALPDGSY